MKRLSALFLCLLAAPAFAQSYWQQKVDTRINVILDDTAHTLVGDISMDYQNNSPDTLHYIYMHLWPNAYSSDRTNYAEQMAENGETDFYFSRKARGNISELSFTVNDRSVNYYSARNIPDVARIDLSEPLPPGGKVTIATPFKVKIPEVTSRLGRTRQAYFISQWFPKPAVYDKKGWHPLPYLNYGEFYSEIGSYDVKITLPKNYVVMATGNCLDETENNWLDELSKKEFPSDTLYKTTWPESSAENKTLHFHEDNVHDFAWFADKRWLVRKDTAVSPGTGDVVTCYSAFLPASKTYWKEATKYLKYTIHSYGTAIGPYPYKTIKAVEGDMSAGGGMEYPTVTIIDRTAKYMLRTVIIHEAGHNWFYGILATNERDHAWMDEGMNTLYEQKATSGWWQYDTVGKKALQDAMEAKIKARTEESGRKPKNIPMTDPYRSVGEEALFYYYETGIHTDQALEQTSANFTELNYGIDVYYKTALMLNWLEQYMGAENFEAGMHDYYNTWKHKHPYPEDFRACMARHTDKDISWFFESVLKTDDRIDYRIVNANENEVKVKNKSGFAAPVYVTAYNKDSVIGRVWSAPFDGTTTLQLPDSIKDWNTLRIGYHVPEGKRQNSVYHRSGLFRHSSPALKGFFGFGYGEKNKIFMLPALGYNYYDGFELGLIFHNLTIPENRFRYILAPMWGFKSKAPVGAGSMGYSWYTDGLFKEILAQVDGKTFHYDRAAKNIPDPLYARYLKVAPSLTFRFNEHDLRSPVTRTLMLKGYSIQEEGFTFSPSPSDSTLFVPSVSAPQQKMYGLVRYLHKNDRTFNPFSYGAEAQLNKDFVKLSAEGKLRIDYFKKNKALHLRAYAGKFIELNATPDISRYYLNSTYTGDKDYLYDGTYFGRNERNGIASRQVSMMEGGFKVPTPYYASQIGRSGNWLFAVNISTDIPKLPLRLFLDVGTFADAQNINPSGQKILYDGGIELTLPYDIVSVYFPIVLSKDLKDYMKAIHGNKVFVNSIVFRIDLNKINWMKAGNVTKLLGM